jgi:hypothetical protein
MDDLMTVKPETVEADFKTAAIGTLVAARWFAKNANTSRVKQGEYPLLLVTGGLLHQVRWGSTYGNRARQLTLTVSSPVLCFAFNRQVSFSKHCHQFFYRPAERVQCAGWAAADRTSYYPQRGRGL